MSPAVPKQTITFENNREATAVFPPANATAQEIIEALKIQGHDSVLLLIGGADSFDGKLKPRLTQLFSRGIARAAATVKAVIVDGGTKAGVMEIMGQGVADRGYKSSLIGVAPIGLVNYPDSTGAGETPLDPNHSHFVLVPGDDWGSETSVMFKLVSGLTSNKLPAVALLAGGGETTRNEALQAVRQSLSLIVVEGSGGLADEIASAWKARPDLPDDPVMAEIVADGRIELLRLANSVRGAERLVVRELGGDNVLMQAWERFADYDLNAILQQDRFSKLQASILIFGLVATALALAREVAKTQDVDVTIRWSFWWFIKQLLIALPILLTVLITATNKFKQGNKWLLLRSGAEAIKREIYYYRTRAGDYKEILDTQSTKPAATGTTPPLPPPTPEQVLSQRVEDVTRRIMRTEVNSSCLIPYDKSKGFPPYMYAAQGGDDGFSILTPDRYVQVRLGDQLSYYRKKAVKLERQLKLFQWSIYIIGGVGTLLAAINQQVWIALTTALAAALTTYLSYKQTENTLMKYNQAATDLENVKSWWTALPADEQARQENVDLLVEHTERVLQSELDGWVQQMQDALAELRKGQAQATEREEPQSGGGPSKPLTDEEKAAAAKTAADQAAAEEAAKQPGGENAGGDNASGAAEDNTEDENTNEAGKDAGGENAGANEADNAVGENTGTDVAEGENAGTDIAVGENTGADNAEQEEPPRR